MIKVNIKYCLFLCLIALSCGSSGHDGEDKFIQINFNSPYSLNTAKSFGFTLSGGVSGSVNDSGPDCIAVTWDGHIDKRSYYGFAVGTDNDDGVSNPTSNNIFNLILYFPKDGSAFGLKTLSPAPPDTAPPSGHYTAVMRYKGKIYKNPQTSITLNIQQNGTLTEVNNLTPFVLTFDSPATVTVTKSSSIMLQPY